MHRSSFNTVICHFTGTSRSSRFLGLRESLLVFVLPVREERRRGFTSLQDKQHGHNLFILSCRLQMNDRCARRRPKPRFKAIPDMRMELGSHQPQASSPPLKMDDPYLPSRNSRPVPRNRATILQTSDRPVSWGLTPWFGGTASPLYGVG